MRYPPLFITGEPRTEGSLVVMPPNGAPCKLCGQKAGRAFARHQQDAFLRRWRQKVAEAVRSWGKPLHDAPCYVLVSFVCTRGGAVHGRERDLDKLTRAILDSLGPKAGGAVTDDKHIAFIIAVKHHVSAARPRAGVTLAFGRLIAEEKPNNVAAAFIERELSDPLTLASWYTGPKPGTPTRRPAHRHASVSLRTLAGARHSLTRPLN